MKKLFFLVFSFLYIFSAFPQKVRVGLFPDKDINAVTFSVVSGNYILLSDDTIVETVTKGRIFLIHKENNVLVLNDTNRLIGRFENLFFRGDGNADVFMLKAIVPSTLSYDYDDDLSISAAGGKISLINSVNTDKYIAGVIEAEGGSNAGIEYYKAQAVLVRTYMYRNMYRHGSEGFNLCNNQHCQAYKGKSILNDEIYEAVTSTDNLVLTDTGNNLIFAPYHANCGGITGTSDLVWNKDLFHLHPVKDPFCAESKNSKWTRKISISEWNSYLEKNGIETGLFRPVAFSGEFKREKYLSENAEILLSKIRDDFNLKSSFFNVSIEKDSVVFNGRGFGHGIGLCQDGAMEMAKAGYTFVDILHYYYQDLEIQPYKK